MVMGSIIENPLLKGEGVRARPASRSPIDGDNPPMPQKRLEGRVQLPGRNRIEIYACVARLITPTFCAAFAKNSKSYSGSMKSVILWFMATLLPMDWYSRSKVAMNHKITD